MKKILIISPKFAPGKDGLSGHTTKLALVLREEFEVNVLTSNSDHSPTSFSNINIIEYSGAWSFSKLYIFWKTSIFKEFDKIIIQYVPSLYNPRGGINFSVIIFFLYLRLRQKAEISIIFHELYYPFSWYWKNLILHFSHKIMLFGALVSAQFSFFSTRRFLNETRSFVINRTKKFHLPVGDNLIHTQQSLSTHQRNEIPNFLIFGSPHPSKRFDLIFESLEEHYLSGGKFKLTIIGPSLDRLGSEISLPENFQQYAIVKPNLDDHEVVRSFETCDCSLAYFSDGLTTRRSSVISALAWGVECLSTESQYTEEVFKNKTFIHLLPSNPDEFKKHFRLFLKKYKPSKTENTDCVRHFYDVHFSWAKIKEKLLFSWKA